MNRNQIGTRILFWSAFGIFLAVSIPHIAWVFHSFEPQGDGFDFFWWPLSYGFAIAIDAVICWLSYVKSTDEGKGEAAVIWGFIATLVLMSWYFNWIYAKAHDPSNTGVNVWTIQMIPQWGFIGGWTIGTITPVIISAMPVFVIAYTYVLNKVTHMKAAASMSLAELQAQADEAILRAQAERRIRDARKGKGFIEFVKGSAKATINAGRELQQELQGAKHDPYAEQEQLFLDFFRTTPALLDDENKDNATVLIAEMLKSKDKQKAEAWRVKIAAILANEAVPNAHVTDAIQVVDQAIDDNAQTSVSTPAIEARSDTQNASVDGDATVTQSTVSEVMTDGMTASSKQTVKLQPNAKKEPPKWASNPALPGVLMQYPNVKRWLIASQATASVSEVVEVTELTRQKVSAALRHGRLTVHARNKNLVLIDSVIDWLYTTIPAKQNEPITDMRSAANTADQDGQNEGVSSPIEGSDLSDIDLSEYEEFDAVGADVNGSNGHH